MAIITKFGSYPQNNGNTKEPIEWLFLDIKANEGEALLISRYGLDCKPYNRKQKDVTWENCDLRKWLNNDFLKAAFTEEEQERILLSEAQNNDNPDYSAIGGNTTRDRIFCLSIEEAEQYFSEEEERLCQATTLAKSHGHGMYHEHYCSWWLRSHGIGQDHAAEVWNGGMVCKYGYYVHGIFNAVRPAMWIKL